MNFLKKILGFSNNQEGQSSESSLDTFTFVGEGKLLGYTNGEKQEMYLKKKKFFINFPFFLCLVSILHQSDSYKTLINYSIIPSI